MATEYVLGTHDEELTRLGLQHRVWRPRALDAWSRAGFTVSQTLIDVGSGPGYASLDLSEIVGPTGSVVAVDRSSRFLDHLRSARRLNIRTHEVDLDRDPLPVTGADGAWVRWVFAFLSRPRDLVARIASALHPGAALVIHEYFDYRTWRFTQRSPIFEEFVATVMRSWRATGGEPDIAPSLLGWLEEQQFRIASTRPIIDVVGPSSFTWQWPKTFVDVGLNRLVELREMTESQAEAVREEFRRMEATPHIRMIMPAVMEIVAVKRSAAD